MSLKAMTKGKSIGRYLIPWIRYRKTSFWTNTRGMHPNRDHSPMVVEINEEHYFIQGTSAVKARKGSIEQIGYPYRCVKNE